MPGASPTDRGSMAPYRTSFLEIAQRYATSPERIEILKGLVRYRSEMRDLGISEGFQWIDGSFVENCEVNRGRPPSDVDVITFSVRPGHCQNNNDWSQLIQSRQDIFHPEQSKSTYKCDAYFVDLSVHPVHLVNQTRYWFGLFSHQRETFLWKGMLEIPLGGDDQDVVDLLGQGDGHAAQA